MLVSWSTVKGPVWLGSILAVSLEIVFLGVREWISGSPAKGTQWESDKLEGQVVEIWRSAIGGDV